MNADTINFLVQIIREFMELANDQVVVYNQGWKIPSDNRLYISVGLLGSKPYGSSRAYEDSPDGKALLEVISLNSQELYSLNVFSYDMGVLARRDEVIMALNSTLAQQMMEKHAFKLATLPVSFRDLSGLEGASRLYRFQADVALLRVRRKENVVQYYDKFAGPALIINP